MDDIAYLVSVQPVMVSVILWCVCAMLILTIVDFVCAMLFPHWHSPSGFKSRKGGRHERNETK